MARLNEPAAPLESLELLRKRFLRQNKEIIKINADQAVRIRNIEAETTRLLSENITLREENIRLNHQINKGRHALALENVGVVKDKLQFFASGLSDLLAELSQAQSTLPEPKPYHDTPKRRSPKSPTQQWRGGLNIAELAEQEGRLPPIVEDKYYPRKTLDAEEIGLLVRASPVRQSPTVRPSPSLADSPDLGPPPVIHFDIGDPSKNGQSPPSPSPVKPRATSVKKLEQDEEPLAISSLLETRKKRRTSTFAGDSEGRPASEPEKMGKHRGSPEAEDDGHALIKAGGKRKYSMREDDEPTQPPKTAPSTDKPSKETESSLELPIRNSRPTKAQTDHSDAKTGKDAHTTEKNTVAVHAKRRALGEKPVNTDPVVSPMKVQARKQREGNDDIVKGDQNISGGKGKGDADHRPHGEPEVNKQTAPGGNSKPSGARHGRKNARVEQVPFLDPVTPAPVVDIAPPEILSAQSTEPEKKSQDTPPPSDFGSRPSRRSRPTISYAEPNLRDKMRRPTKDLIDAVATDGKGNRSSNVGELQGLAATEAADVHDESIPNWRTSVNEPASPLATRSEVLSSAPALPSTVATERKRRSFVAPKKAISDVKTEVTEQSSSPSSPSSPEQTRNLHAGRGGRRAHMGKDTVNIQSVIQDAYRASAAQHAAERDVFDVGSSSPESGKGVPIRMNRRVTSVPDNLNMRAGNSSRRGGNNRRRETMANNASNSNTSGGMNSRGKEGGAVDTEPGQQSESEAFAGERRMATRRRSMML